MSDLAFLGIGLIIGGIGWVAFVFQWRERLTTYQQFERQYLAELRRRKHAR